MKTGGRKKQVNGDEKGEKTTKTEKTMRITKNTVREKKGHKRGKRKRVEKRQKDGKYDKENKYSKKQREKIKGTEDKDDKTPRKQLFLYTSEMNYTRIIGMNSKYRLSLLHAALTDTTSFLQNPSLYPEV